MNRAQRRATAKTLRGWLPDGQRERNLQELGRMVSPEALQEVRALLLARNAGQGHPWGRCWPCKIRPPMAPIPDPADLTPEQWARLLAAVFGPRPPRLIRLPRGQAMLIRLPRGQALRLGVPGGAPRRPA
jgi:hypothetical protein